MWLYENDKSYEAEIQTIVTSDMAMHFIENIEQSGQKKYYYLYGENGATENVLLIRKIYNPDDYTMIGYLVVLCSIEYLDGIVSNSNTETTFQMGIYENNTTSVYVKDTNYIKTAQDFMQKSIQWQVNAGEGLLLVRTTIKNTDWSIISTQRLDDLLGNVIEYRRIVFVSILILQTEI